METDGKDAGRTFEIFYGLTDKEIELLAWMSAGKQARIAPPESYYLWMFAAGAGLSYAGGAIAHSYYGVPLHSPGTALVMALFTAYAAGALAYRRLLAVWHKRISDWRIAKLKEAFSLQIDRAGIVLTEPGIEWHAAWGAIEDVTFAGETVVLWYSADTGLMIPLRAIPAGEERSAFVDAIKVWSNAR